MVERLILMVVLGAIFAAADAVAGCGGGARAQHAAGVVAPRVKVADSVVARVGTTVITQATLAHWTSVLTSSPAAQHQTRQQAALSFLISAQWLIGEASHRGLRISASAIKQRLEVKDRKAFPNGDREVQAFLEVTGQTTADLQFRARVELAATRLRRLLTDEEPPRTATQIAAYYGSHKQSFVLPERRYIQFIERTKLPAAQQARREIEGGRRIPRMEPLNEWLVRFAKAGSREGEHIERQLFTPHLNVLTGPIRLFQSYAVFVVARIVPSRLQPLALVRAVIARRLQADERRRTLSRFTQTWTEKWTALTDCMPGYVVQQCRQHRGTNAPPPQDPFAVE